MRIGFYGDSFCHEIENPHSRLYKYNTYIKLLKQYYDAEIINLGVGGSGYWDIILSQFNLNNLPDVAIFCWSDFDRLYHPSVRNITRSTALQKGFKNYLDRLCGGTFLNFNVWKAAKLYFKHLSDHNKNYKECQAALFYFDEKVLSKTNTKIIHMWSFEHTVGIHDWKNGSTIMPALSNFAFEGNWTSYDANHLGNQEKNNQIFELIKEEIDK